METVFVVGFVVVACFVNAEVKGFVVDVLSVADVVVMMVVAVSGAGVLTDVFVTTVMDGRMVVAVDEINHYNQTSMNL